jgi:5-formyltetrahydrofolate cyclo-ligase
MEQKTDVAQTFRPMTPSELNDPPVVADEKRALREHMRKLRLVAEQKEGPDAALAVIRHVVGQLDGFGLAAGAVVAGYWPISTELDVRPLLARLEDRGLACALPAIEGGDVLVFRRWRPTDDLEPGIYQTRQPPPTAPVVHPRLLFVPLLAVDRHGHRLGHGRGWYDRSLAALRQQGPVTAVGVGFGLQVIERVPFGPADERVDWILTERAIERVRG